MHLVPCQVPRPSEPDGSQMKSMPLELLGWWLLPDDAFGRPFPWMMLQAHPMSLELQWWRPQILLLEMPLGEDLRFRRSRRFYHSPHRRSHPSLALCAAIWAGCSWCPEISLRASAGSHRRVSFALSAQMSRPVRFEKPYESRTSGRSGTHTHRQEPHSVTRCGGSLKEDLALAQGGFLERAAGDAKSQGPRPYRRDT